MDIEQMTLEQQHDFEVKDWQVKCKKLEQDCENLFKVRDEWANLASERLQKINDLSKQINDQQAQITKLTETLVELDIKFKAVKSISQVAGKSDLTHAQRKVLAWVQENILTGATGETKPITLYDEF